MGGVGIREARALEGRYLLLEQLGVGGMSVVWRGHDRVLGRPVAIKVLAPELAPDHASRDRIRTEAQAVARLCHPHITNVYDYGEARCPGGGTVPYVVMELIDGEPMSARLRHGAAMPWYQAVVTCAEVASALAVAHASGIVHRDVNPNNVMLTAAGAKVVDFGISAPVGENDVGPDGALLGTPAYLAPERMDAGVVCPASDVYAVGLLLYRALTGRLPWRASSTTDLLKAHRYADPGPMPPVPGLPAVVAELCRRCLAKRPEDRPSAAGVARTLAAEAGIVVFLPPVGNAGPVGGVAPEVGMATTAIRPWPPRSEHRGSHRPYIPEPTSDLSPVVAFARRLAGARRRAEALLGAAALLAVGGLVWTGTSRAPETPTAAGAGAGGLPGAQPLALGLGHRRVDCRVGYRLREDTGREFTAAVTVTNTGQQPIDDWQMQFAFPGDQRLRWGSGAVIRQDGTRVAVLPSGGGGRLRPGASVRMSMTGNYRSANPLPVVFILNGSACRAVVSGVDAGTVAGRPYPYQGGTAAGNGGGAAGGDRRDGAGRRGHQRNAPRPAGRQPVGKFSRLDPERGNTPDKSFKAEKSKVRDTEGGWPSWTALRTGIRALIGPSAAWRTTPAAGWSGGWPPAANGGRYPDRPPGWGREVHLDTYPECGLARGRSASGRGF